MNLMPDTNLEEIEEEMDFTIFAPATAEFMKEVKEAAAHTLGSPPITEFYQTEYAKETVCIIKDSDGSISIGIARAGHQDIKARRVSSAEGMRTAEGRARKARKLKTPLIKKNYLRGIHLKKVEPTN